MKRPEHFIHTQSGKFWPSDPRIDELHIEDIGLALSNLCRFNGHVRKFYSVAEHSMLVASFLPEELKRWGLLHDAAEAYVGDMPRPIKAILNLESPAFYENLEEQILKSIAQRFELVWPIPDEVKHADDVALCTEAVQFFGPEVLEEWGWAENVAPATRRIFPMSPEVAFEYWRIAFDRTEPTL